MPDADVVMSRPWWETAEWVWPLSDATGTQVHFLTRIMKRGAHPTATFLRIDAVIGMLDAEVIVVAE